MVKIVDQMFARDSLLTIVALLMWLVLAACGSSAPVEQPIGIGGAVSPEVVAENFFEDFGLALNDPQLQNDSTRERWAGVLANYFAPNERETHRQALQDMLDSFARELETDVAEGEAFMLEVRYDGFAEQDRNGGRALVEVVNGRVYWQVLVDGNLVAEDEVPLTQIIGRNDNAVPTVQIGTNWFLTDQYE